MTPISPGLPHWSALDVGSLSRLFHNTTNSYKFLFFLGLLRRLRAQSFDPDIPVTFGELAIEMLVLAWYPSRYFRLSFGKQDQIIDLLDESSAVESIAGAPFGPRIEALRQLLERSVPDRQRQRLLRWVPYRLLRTFFERETRGLQDSKVNSMVVELSESHFDDRKPLYRIDAPQGQIWVHPEWCSYLWAHDAIVEGWACWHWLQYMQERNPNVPAVNRKLFPPEERRPLTWQSQLWRPVIEQTEVRCIYSDRLLTGKGFALDHFLPWSFVVHDRLWNLVPVSPSANSSKGNALPAPVYIERLTEQHYAAFTVWTGQYQGRKWEEITEHYTADLRIAMANLMNLGELSRAYRMTLEPMMSLAKTQAFPSDWTYG